MTRRRQHVSHSAGSYFNRAQYMERRRELAQLWADLLMEGMPAAAELLKLPRK